MSARSSGRRWLPLLGTSAALLTWSTAVVPALPSDPVVRTAANLAAVSVLLAGARRGGLGRAELGMAQQRARVGAGWGAAALGLVGAGYAAALAVPALRAALADEGAGLPVGEVVLRAGLLIPLGTVLCEEVAFRGVLHAVARRVLRPGPAVGVGSVVFALWHVRLGEGPPPAGVLVVTAVGGVLLGVLRERTGSVLAPMGLHLGTNAAGLVAAAVAARLPPG